MHHLVNNYKYIMKKHTGMNLEGDLEKHIEAIKAGFTPEARAKIVAANIGKKRALKVKEKPVKKKGTTRHKPGWGRVFAPDDKFQNDPFFWKLFDIVMLRDVDAWKNIKGPHSEAYVNLNPQSAKNIRRKKKET